MTILTAAYCDSCGKQITEDAVCQNLHWDSEALCYFAEGSLCTSCVDDKYCAEEDFNEDR